jgi:carboxylesterase
MKIRAPENVIKGAEGFYLEGNQTGILLIHGGGGGTASDMREIANYLHEKTNWSIFVPLLPGYGTKKEDLAKTKPEDWVNSLKQWLEEFKEEMKNVFVVGHSIGGVLCLILAEELSEKISGVVSISTPIKLKGFLMKLVPFFKLFIKYWKVNDPEEFARISDGLWRGYEKIPLNVVSKFNKIMKQNRNNLDKIKVPVLIIQGKQDQYISENSANIIYDGINFKNKSIEWFNTNHEILFSDEKIKLYETIINFIEKLT